MQFHIGQRVRTAVNAPALFDGGFAAPTGTGGVISRLPLQDGTDYGVLLDGDPYDMAASYEPHELAADVLAASEDGSR